MIIQLIINILEKEKKIPYSILDIIKSFLFYDRKDYQIIKNSRKIKEKMFYIINNVMISRANNFDNDSDYSDNKEHWIVGFLNDDEKIQLQAENCNNCGHYMSHSKDPNLFSNNIYCKCEYYYYDDQYSETNDSLDSIEDDQYSETNDSLNSINNNGTWDTNSLDSIEDDQYSESNDSLDSIEDNITFYMNSLSIS